MTDQWKMSWVSIAAGKNELLDFISFHIFFPYPFKLLRCVPWVQSNKHYVAIYIILSGDKWWTNVLFFILFVKVSSKSTQLPTFCHDFLEISHCDTAISFFKIHREFYVALPSTKLLGWQNWISVMLKCKFVR